MFVRVWMLMSVVCLGWCQIHANTIDLCSDTWVATDALGRTVPGYDECGPVKPNKKVGIFYWTWHTPGRGGPYDNTKLLAQAKNGQVTWPSPEHASHHWG